MLKKFYIEDYLNYKFVQEEASDILNEEILNEAIQGDISKHTLMQLFSSDNIKYLNQFLPKDHKAAEKQRMEILYQAMEDRNKFFEKDFSKNFAEQKNKLKELFNKKKTEKVYFTKDFEETIINHCARKQAWEKTLKEGDEAWWNSSSSYGGSKYLDKQYIVEIKDRRATRKYKINLYLKDMVKRIEGDIGSEHGSDLSFPRIDPYHYDDSGKSRKFKTKKRFNGMLIPEDDTISTNYDRWLAASASGLLSPSPLKHGDEAEIEGEEISLPGYVGNVKKKINFIKHDSLKDKKMLDVEKVLLRKEIRGVFEKENLSINIINSYYGKKQKKKPEGGEVSAESSTFPKIPEDYKNNLSYFVYKLYQLRVLTFLNKIAPLSGTEEDFSKNISDPENFIKKIIELSEDEKKLIPEMVKHTGKEEGSEEDNKTEKSEFTKYNEMANAVKEHGVIKIFDNQSFKNSFINLIIAKQLINWIKENNFRTKNPITGNEEVAKIEGDKIVFPDLYQPTYKKNITYYEDKSEYVPKSQRKDEKEAKKSKEVAVTVEDVDMPILLPGSILVEKEREDIPEDSSMFVKKPKIGQEIWNPHDKKYEQRYYDLKNYYLNKQAAGLLTGSDLIGIQGSEDKIFGGLSPNRKLESFKSICPDPDDERKDRIFWNKLNSLMIKNGNLEMCHFEPEGASGEPEISYKKILPSVTDKELNPSYGETFVEKSETSKPYTDFVVIRKIADMIWNKLKGTRVRDSHRMAEEKLVLQLQFPTLYHLIQAKIFTNMGDELMYDEKGLKDFISEKVQNYIDKNIAGKNARGKRQIEKSTVTLDPEDEKSLKAIVSKEKATTDFQAFNEALHRNFLHLCLTGKGYCGTCKDSIEQKCQVVVDELILKEAIEKAIALTSKADEVRFIHTETPQEKPKLEVPKIQPTQSQTTQPPKAQVVQQKQLTTPQPIQPQATPVPEPVQPPVSAQPKIQKIEDPDHNKIEYVLHAKNAVVECLKPIMLARETNIMLNLQQEKYEKEFSYLEEFLQKQSEILSNPMLSAEERKLQIEKQTAAKQEKMNLLSLEHQEVLNKFKKQDKLVIKKITDYFNYLGKTKSLKEEFLKLLSFYQVDIRRQLPEEKLKEYGLD